MIHYLNVLEMPRTFNPNPKHPAVAYLIRLHADIGGRILDNKRQAERLAADAVAVEAVIKMFDPEFNARAISARRRVTGNPWFKRGTLFRCALDALRDAGAPLTVRELTNAVLAVRGITDATDHQHEMLQQALRSSLENNVGKTVERAGEGIPMGRIVFLPKPSEAHGADFVHEDIIAPECDAANSP
jgi:hypothetical protein